MIKERTLEVINFFVEDLDFDPNSILYFTEDEIRQMAKLLDQSQIFKQYTTHLHDVLERQARRIFIRNDKEDDK